MLLFGRWASTCHRVSINPTCCNAVILPAVTRDVNIRFRTILSGHAIAYRWRSLRSHHHESNNLRLSSPIDWYVISLHITTVLYTPCGVIAALSHTRYYIHMPVSPVAQLVTSKPSDTLRRAFESRYKWRTIQKSLLHKIRHHGLRGKGAA